MDPIYGKATKPVGQPARLPSPQWIDVAGDEHGDARDHGLDTRDIGHSPAFRRGWWFRGDPEPFRDAQSEVHLVPETVWLGLVEVPKVQGEGLETLRR
jgi:hypothetical protein